MAKKSTAVSINVEQRTRSLQSLDQVPDYLNGDRQTGLDSLDQTDFKVPRIKILQPLNPEIKSFQGKAIPGEFWHTGSNTSLGLEFNFVPCIASKKVILWNPRDEGGGMLAFSSDGKTWQQGANTEFSVKIKNVKKPIIWSTGKDVQSSGLLNWGTFNPDDPDSGPAAQLSYEYLCYLPDFPNLSPVVMGVSRTAIANAKAFNTALLMLRKPIQSVQVRCFSDEKSEDVNTWWVPNFEMSGFVGKDIYDIAKSISEKQAGYKTDYEHDEAPKAHSDTY